MTIEKLSIICDTCHMVLAQSYGSKPPSGRKRRAIEKAVETHKARLPEVHHELRAKIDAAG